MRSFMALWLDTVKPFFGGCCFAAAYGLVRIVIITLTWFSVSVDSAETTAWLLLCVLGVFTFIAFLRWEEERHRRRKDSR